MHWSSSVCYWTSKTIEQMIIEGMRKDSEEYSIEIDAVVPSIENKNIYPSKHLDRVFRDDVLPDREGGKDSYCIGGLDFGEVSGSALTIMEYPRMKIVYRHIFKGSIDTTFMDIIKVLTEYKVLIVKADIRPSSYQGWLERYTKIPIYYVNNKGIKKNMILYLAKLIREHKLIAPNHFQDLKLQLLRYHLGKIRNDDLVDALALTVYEDDKSKELIDKERGKKDTHRCVFFPYDYDGKGSKGGLMGGKE